LNVADELRGGNGGVGMEKRWGIGMGEEKERRKNGEKIEKKEG